MSTKQKRDDDGTPKITIRTGREAPEKSNAFLDMLRDGEKPRAGEPGTLADRLGNVVTAFRAEQVRVAGIRGTAVSGSISISIKVITGPDGSHQYATDIKASPARVPPGVSMIFTDEDGEQIGRPAAPEERQIDFTKGKAPATAEPKAGAASTL